MAASAEQLGEAAAEWAAAAAAAATTQRRSARAATVRFIVRGRIGWQAWRK